MAAASVPWCRAGHSAPVQYGGWRGQQAGWSARARSNAPLACNLRAGQCRSTRLHLWHQRQPSGWLRRRQGAPAAAGSAATGRLLPRAASRCAAAALLLPLLLGLRRRGRAAVPLLHRLSPLLGLPPADDLFQTKGLDV